VEIVVLIGARPYALPERSAIELRDLIRTRAPDDRPLGYLADAISEDLEHGESPEPLDLGHEQVEALGEISSARSWTSRYSVCARPANVSQSPELGALTVLRSCDLCPFG
jgi:hypothetical protein